MNTLIELFDERTIENVIGPETFKPEQIIYLCPPEMALNKARQKKLAEYFEYRGLETKLKFEECSLYKADRILRQLNNIAAAHPGCVLDVTGGTDAALFAAGMFCQQSEVPTFTYSRKKNCFYDISNADFADEKPCELEYRVEDFFRMTGGTLRKGRVDNRILSKYMDSFDDFFWLFMKHRDEWTKEITFMQRISRPDKDGNYTMKVEGEYYQKGENGSRIKASPSLLRDLEKLGYLKDVSIVKEESVAFTFADDQIRAWLRDVGSVLELYVYKLCIELGIFTDVISSAVVDWDGTIGHGSVSNEIDVAATRGVVPLFISCKACEVKTEAINELAILKDRFGGKGAKAAIVTTESCNAAARHRAAQLGIAVIDLEELEMRQAKERIQVIMKLKDDVK